MRAEGIASILLVLMVATPPLALAASGEFVTSGGISFTPAAQLTLTALAALAADTSAAARFDLASHALTVCRFEYAIARVGMDSGIETPTSKKQACYPLTNVSVSPLSPGDNAGWMGLYPDERATLQADSHRIDPDYSGILASPGAERFSTDSPDNPTHPFYYRQQTGSHLRMNVSGAWAYSGPGQVKIAGMDLLLHADENQTVIRTGEEVQQGPPGPLQERVLTWVVLSFESGTLETDVGLTQVLARSAPALAHHGSATLRPEAGALEDGEVEYPATGSVTTINGTFTGSAMPAPGGNGIRLALAGSLDATTLEAVHIPAPQGAKESPAWPALVATILGGFALSGVVVVQLKRRASRREPARGPLEVVQAQLSAREYATRAEDAESRQMWLTAADLWHRARIYDPEEPRYALQEGFCLLQAGKVEASLAVLETAARLQEDGEPEVLAARAAMRLENPDLAERFLARALDRRPTKEILALLDDPELAEVVASPTIQSALDDVNRAARYFGLRLR